MLEGFKPLMKFLLNAVKGISDIINIPGRVNVDFADVKSPLGSEMGMALYGYWNLHWTKWSSRSCKSCKSIRLLLEDIDIEGATGILINITGTSSMTLHEISEASTLIQEAAHEEANIIFGAVIDEKIWVKLLGVTRYRNWFLIKLVFLFQKMHTASLLCSPIHNLFNKTFQNTQAPSTKFW